MLLGVKRHSPGTSGREGKASFHQPQHQVPCISSGQRTDGTDTLHNIRALPAARAGDQQPQVSFRKASARCCSHLTPWLLPAARRFAAPRYRGVTARLWVRICASRSRCGVVPSTKATFCHLWHVPARRLSRDILFSGRSPEEPPPLPGPAMRTKPGPARSPRRYPC